jgi:hypothetical protein
MVEDGRIQLPSALGTKAHRDFELTVHAAASVGDTEPATLRPAVAEVGLSQAG